MDRFKFRAFSKGTMCDPFDFESLYHAAFAGVIPALPFDEYIIMQCTGLKDKYGKLIYEGDIVKMNAHISRYHDEYGQGTEIDMDFIGPVVVLPSKGACIKKPRWIDNMEDNKRGQNDGYKPISAYRTEIIGNIYEHPELLGKQK